MIRLEQVSRTYQVGEQPVHALVDIDLHVTRGEYLSVMGPSGSGKSTLLHILGLLDRPSRGRYLLDGRDVTRLGDAEQARLRLERVGFVFQFFHLVPRLTAAQNVALPMVLAGRPPEERKRRVAELLAVTGLTDRADHRPDQLSGGQRQRVAIARAMVMNPSLLLADEPTGNLDRRSGEEIITLLESLNRQGLTLIVVTHDPALGGRARRRIRMLDGRIVADEATP
ncbi:MAG TPA: ABC transporter ATP-binding protein [Gammaproteobacteria bacterium]|nr:ABC transporter ATP-binding protein [Gammaproteobacteria bacterium]